MGFGSAGWGRGKAAAVSCTMRTTSTSAAAKRASATWRCGGSIVGCACRSAAAVASVFEVLGCQLPGGRGRRDPPLRAFKRREVARRIAANSRRWWRSSYRRHPSPRLTATLRTPLRTRTPGWRRRVPKGAPPLPICRAVHASRLPRGIDASLSLAGGAAGQGIVSRRRFAGTSRSRVQTNASPADDAPQEMIRNQPERGVRPAVWAVENAWGRATIMCCISCRQIAIRFDCVGTMKVLKCIN